MSRHPRHEERTIAQSFEQENPSAGSSPHPGCPRCGWDSEASRGICTRCNLDLGSVSLVDPKHFLWASLLFSFVVPGIFAARNWKRMGEGRRGRDWLLASLVGFVGLILSGSFLHDLDPGGSVLLVYLINLPIGLYLKQSQQTEFQRFQSAGAGESNPVPMAFAGVAALFAITLSLSLVMGAVPTSGPETVQGVLPVVFDK